jgi:tetratricopeptide (TPR) repeat protein
MAGKLSSRKFVPLLLPLLAGAAGGGLVWIGMRSDAPSSPRTVPNIEHAETPPNVAHLPPAQSAVTLGNWHYDRQRWAQAIDQYEAAIRLGVDNADIRTDLGNCYRFIGQPLKALELYQSAQRQDPQHENSLFNQAGLYAETLNEPSKAIAAAGEFIRRFPQSSGAAAAQQMIARLKGNSGAEQQLADWIAEDKAATPNAKP